MLHNVRRLWTQLTNRNPLAAVREGLWKRLGGSRWYASETQKETHVPLLESQAPGERPGETKEVRFGWGLLLWPLCLWICYDTLFVRRNIYSNRRTVKFICRHLERYIGTRFMTRMLARYKPLLCKQSIEDSQRVQRVLQEIIKANQLDDLSRFEVRLYDLPNLFIYMSADGCLYISIKTLLLADNDSELAFLLSHELAHFLLDHNQARLLRYKMNSFWTQQQPVNSDIPNEADNDFEKLSQLNKLVCYYPSYCLLDKFEERDVDALAYILLHSCPCFEKSKSLSIIDKIKEYMNGYPIKMSQVVQLKGKYMYDRKEANKTLLAAQDSVQPFSVFASNRKKHGH